MFVDIMFWVFLVIIVVLSVGSVLTVVFILIDDQPQETDENNGDML